MKSTHMLLCALLLVGAVALIATGFSGFLLLPVLLCAVMMGTMMWMMMGGRRGGSDR
jgi:hypothetical protein